MDVNDGLAALVPASLQKQEYFVVQVTGFIL